MNHTPGPWHRNIKPVTKYPTIFAGRSTHIAKIVEHGIGLSEAEANCDLIAAAPDLLAALLRMVEWADNVYYKHDTTREFLAAKQQAKDAITSATGGAS